MPCNVLLSREAPTCSPEGRPCVIASFAISLDGKLVSHCGDSRLSSREDKIEVHKLRSQVDAILVGINTILKDDPHLTVSQKYYISDRHPIRIVLDSKLRVPLNAEVITRRPEVPTIIASTTQAPKEKIEELKARGVRVLVLGEKRVDIRRLLEILWSEYRVRSLMVEGGGSVLSSFFRAGLVDRVRVSINPVLFGEGGSVGFTKELSICRVEDSPRLNLFRIELCGHSVVLHYWVER